MIYFISLQFHPLGLSTNIHFSLWGIPVKVLPNLHGHPQQCDKNSMVPIES